MGQYCLNLAAYEVQFNSEMIEHILTDSSMIGPENNSKNNQ